MTRISKVMDIGLSLDFLDSKLLGMTILFRLREAQGKEKNSAAIRMGRGCLDHVFTLRKRIDKYLSHQTTLSFIDKKQLLGSVDELYRKFHLCTNLLGSYKEPAEPAWFC